MSEEVKWGRGHHSNGQLCWETSFVNGQAHGIEKWWYPNGQLSYEMSYVNGQKHGTERWWKKDGKLWNVQKWHRGQRVIYLEFDPIPSYATMELDLITNEMSYE
jgi:antitoxin component YwqK of YwqJK toxin-antitoxin module